MKRLFYAMFLMASVFGTQTASAADFNVRIINLSNGISTVGQPASANLQAMAEGGDIAGLVTDLQGLGATIAENPAGGLLAPAAETDVDLNTDGTSNELLTIVAMLLPTNDAFAGLSAFALAACSSSDDPAPDPPAPAPAMASFDVTVTNLTNAQPLSPVAVVAHQVGYSMFTIGNAATAGLETLAEGGAHWGAVRARIGPERSESVELSIRGFSEI